ncbi:MAG: ABC transporter ATP-binding protein/permease [Actinomycetota bacterium]|nr:ABC transporter ATP-binding protein/permease [Actinomycetota bacterium]
MTDGLPGPATAGPAAGRWRLLTGVLRQQRRGLMIGVAIGGVWMVGKLAVPQLLRIAIDRGIVGGGALWIWPALIVCAGLLAGTFTALRRYVAFREARWTEATLRERLFDHIMSLHVGYHDRSQTGQLMSRASSDLGLIQMFVTMVPITIANLGMILSVFVILFLTDPLLALAAVAPLPFIQIVQRRFSNRIHPVVLELQREQGELATVVEESVTGVRVVKGFGAEQVQIDKLEHEAEEIRRVSLRSAHIRSVYLPAIELLPQIGLVAVLGLGGHRVLSGQLTIGELVAFNAYVALTVFPLRMLGMTLAWGQRAGVALERINEVLTTVPAVADPSQPEHLPEATPGGAIRFDGVTFGYDAEAPVLHDFTLHIDAGRSVALVGGTGAGKSTVARLLVRFYEPGSGTITLDGVDTSHLALHELRRAVGIVFEDTLLFHDTAAANISFACPDADRQQVVRAARLAGAHDFIVDLPDGYDTLLGERGLSLSGGQRQRIAIARAIIADPRVLVLDDATSSVDPSKEHEIREAMRTVMDNRTTVVIAHRPATIDLADTVVLLDGGRVAATGSHGELVGGNARYREVLASMATRDEARRRELQDEEVAPDGSDAVSSRPPSRSEEVDVGAGD